MFNCVTNICNLDFLRLQCPKRLKCSHFTPSWPNETSRIPNVNVKVVLKLLLMEETRLTSWYGESTIFYRVLSISGGAGILPSTVPPESLSLGAAQTLQISSPSTANVRVQMVNLLPWRSIDWVWMGGMMEGIWRWGVAKEDEEAYLGGGFTYVVFSSRTLGKWFNLTDIFQMGWSHQLVINNSKSTYRFQFTGIVPSTSRSFENMLLIGSTRFEIETSTPYNITFEMTDMVRLNHKSWLFFRFGCRMHVDRDSISNLWQGLYQIPLHELIMSKWDTKTDQELRKRGIPVYSAFLLRCRLEDTFDTKNGSMSKSIRWIGETHLSRPFKATPKPPAFHDPVSRPH